MANKTVTVMPSGGDYTSLAAAIAGELTANADLVSMEGILTISIEGDWSGGADTNYASIDGFTTSSDYYVNVVADSANAYAGVYDADKYRLQNTNAGSLLQLRSHYTRVTGLQVINTRGNAGRAIYLRGDSAVIKDSYISGYDGIQSDNYNASSWHAAINCVVIDCPNYGINITQGNPTKLYNCTVVNCGGVGINLKDDADSVAINCYSGNNTGADYAGANATLTTCFSEDGSLSTSTATYSTDNFTNVTAGSEDLSLPSGSDLIDAGTDLSSDATFPFDWDINGTTRSGTWDVGAYEYSAGGGGDTSIPVIMHHLAMMRR